MLDFHATLTLMGEGSIVFVQPFPIAHAMGQAIAPSLVGGFFRTGLRYARPDFHQPCTVGQAIAPFVMGEFASSKGVQ